MPLRYTLALGLLLLSGGALAQPALFTPGVGGDLTPRQAEVLGTLQATPVFVRADVGRVNPAALLGGTEVTVALPDGPTVTLRRTGLERRSADDASWFGRGADDTVSGVFVVRDGGITGTIHADGRLYTLRPLGGGLHALALLDGGAFRDHGEDYGAFEAAELARIAQEGPPERAAETPAQRAEAPVYTVLVVYTAGARAAVADIGALVQLAVDETNLSYANSGVAARVALAYTYETPTAGSTSMNTDLPAIRDVGDGRFDEVHALRTAYRADVVSLIGVYSDNCGLGYLNSSAASAFSVVQYTCATGYYSFGHEIGHNFGAHHDTAIANNTTYPYGHGWVSLEGDWRTVMAYNNTACPGGSCTRIPHWSDSSILYNGLPTGDVPTRDNARVLDQRAAAMASFQFPTVTLAGDAGWRMMAAPVAGMAVDNLAAQNLVQGVPGLYPTETTNLYTGYTGAGWAAPAGTGDALGSGRGFLWYLFDAALAPGGASQSVPLPMILVAPSATASPGGSVEVGLHTAGDRWNLLGNPYPTGLDVTTMAAWASGGTLASAVGQVWDPAEGSFVLTTTTDHTVAAWQGFFVENDTADTLTIPPAARVVGGTFLRDGDPEERVLAFRLEGTEAATGRALADRALAVVFHPDALDGADLLDATKLQPLASTHAALAIQTTSPGGAPLLRAQEGRPYYPLHHFTLPLAFDAAGTTSAFTLRWTPPTSLPAAWTLTLRDLTTGTVTNLRATDHYTFTATPDAPRVDPTALPAALTADPADYTARFEVTIDPGSTAAGDGAAPAAFALDAPAPSPARGVATLAYRLPEAADVRLEVFDVTGRRVATLVDGRVAAGAHRATLDASTLAPGVYVVRMRAGAFVSVQRVTVAR
ncbi:MAG TPA: M12 family metallo-peptidase [Rhodothermales bacterium]|nr:M12 family metallo-peptidase [Rhodothermales bacterium]